MKTDIIVVGGGHAGIEAAYAASKYGMSVMLITQNIDNIGYMSCNPAIGGISKGNIVKEIDAFGGLMAKVIDKAGIQFRMLNSSKGVAVWGPRAQADKNLYVKFVRQYLDKIENIHLYQNSVVSLIVENGKVCGVITESGESIRANSVILTMGTFLNGTAHVGMNSFSCGRIGEPASLKLSENIQSFGIKAGRLKTGTPARVDSRSVDFSLLEEQKGDGKVWPFSFSTNDELCNKAVCWHIKTNNKTHDIIRDNLDKSPLYGGKITGIGPRYCPSIEDKIVRFGDREGHTLFLEPEGLETNEMYLNGFSTSLPFDVQEKMLRSLPGLENVNVLKPAYAIEYDYFLPTQLYSTLESRIIENLYFAGQLNGTSGYEEAACQGLIAGINAAIKNQGKDSLVLGRDTSYTGVLIDDLVTKGTEEPYRMFTSRAEYRLMLRQDNADERLMPIAYEHGLIDDKTYNSRKKVWEKRKKIKSLIKEGSVTPELWEKYGNKDTEVKQKVKASDLLKRPEVNIDHILNILNLTDLDDNDKVTIEADIKYEGFIVKQKKEIERKKQIENLKIPEELDYNTVSGLLNESREKLKKIKPLTLGQASRISGVNPSDISILLLHITRM